MRLIEDRANYFHWKNLKHAYIESTVKFEAFFLCKKTAFVSRREKLVGDSLRKKEILDWSNEEHDCCWRSILKVRLKNKQTVVLRWNTCHCCRFHANAWEPIKINARGDINWTETLRGRQSSLGNDAHNSSMPSSYLLVFILLTTKHLTCSAGPQLINTSFDRYPCVAFTDTPAKHLLRWTCRHFLMKSLATKQYLYVAPRFPFIH